MKKSIKNILIIIFAIVFILLIDNKCFSYSKKMFKARDTNGNGEISKKEIIAFCNKKGYTYNQEDLELIISNNALSKLSDEAIITIMSSMDNRSKHFNKVKKEMTKRINEGRIKYDGNNYEIVSEEDREKEIDKQEKNKEEYKDYSASEILDYYQKNGGEIPSGCEEVWEETLKKEIDKLTDEGAEDNEIYQYQTAYDAITGETTSEQTNIFQAPSKKDTGGSAGDSFDDMITDADSFVSSGETEDVYEATALQKFSSNLFNIFATVGVAVAIIVGIIIGIKYMTGSIDAKAEVKKMLIPYLVGCLVVFGGFGIWKLAIIILSSV